jgi:hypothetical protein
MGFIGIVISSPGDAFARSDGFSVRHVDRRRDRVRRPDGLAFDSEEIAGDRAIIGALARYLDFINLFLLLLQLFGQRRLD